MYIKTSNQEKINMGFGGYTCNWGLHICGLYETEEERDEIIFGFLHQGDVEGNMQLYCPSERSRENFIEEYGERFPDCSRHPHDPSHFSLKTPKEFYYPDDVFSPVSMDRGLNNYFEDSQRHGKRYIRATAEMAWAVEAIPGVEKLMVYEARLNYFIPGKPWISICLYNVTKFSGKTIMNVLRTHPFVISGGVITQNPYYQEPEEWLKQNAPEYANKQL